MRWMIGHASMLLTNYHRSPDDQKTGYERLRGHSSNASIAEFGEVEMFFTPNTEQG